MPSASAILAIEDAVPMVWQVPDERVTTDSAPIAIGANGNSYSRSSSLLVAPSIVTASDAITPRTREGANLLTRTGSDPGLVGIEERIVVPAFLAFHDRHHRRSPAAQTLMDAVLRRLRAVPPLYTSGLHEAHGLPRIAPLLRYRTGVGIVRSGPKPNRP